MTQNKTGLMAAPSPQLDLHIVHRGMCVLMSKIDKYIKTKGGKGQKVTCGGAVTFCTLLTQCCRLVVGCDSEILFCLQEDVTIIRMYIVLIKVIR